MHTEGTVSLNRVLVVFLVVFAVIGCASRAKADGIDPNIDVDPVFCNAFLTNPLQCPGPLKDSQPFTVIADATGGGITLWTNIGTTNWTTLTLTETGVDPSTIHCNPGDAFPICDEIPTGPTSAILFFNFGSCTICGITPGFTVGINLDDPGSTTGGWPPGFELTGAFNTTPIPEPSTMLLLGSGALATIWRRRKNCRP